MAGELAYDIAVEHLQHGRFVFIAARPNELVDLYWLPNARFQCPALWHPDPAVRLLVLIGVGKVLERSHGDA